MPHRESWLGRIKAVEREYVATRQAIDLFLEQSQRNPTTLRDDLAYKEIVRASENLEGTYLVRLFAEFETGLRQYWKTLRDTHPLTFDLLEGLAARRTIAYEQKIRAHDVRKYRNSLVHESEEEIEQIPIAEARRYLCRYFAFLPPDW